MTLSPKVRFEAPKGIIARRNQDGTVILMRLDESSLFYKLTGQAAEIWGELKHRPTIEEIISNYGPSVEPEIRKFFDSLLKNKLIEETRLGPDSSYPLRPRSADDKKKDSSASFGGLKEFDLEEIETEVLNESIYLDVFAGSDLRLKQNISPVNDALEKITQLEGITYEWKGELPPSLGVATSGTHAGLIAQQVASVMPELVRADKSSGYLGIEYSKLTSYLVEAIKDLNKMVTAQSDKIQELEKRLEADPDQQKDS